MGWIYKIGVGEALTQAEMENNADLIYKWGMYEGFTIEAISALCGYLQKESTLNPGVKQGESESSSTIGWGMLQWTPATVLTNWCTEYGYTWYDGSAQLEVIKCEGEGTKGCGGRFYPGGGYSYTWAQMKQLTSISEFIYAYFYERGRGVEQYADFAGRIRYANAWLEYFGGKPEPLDDTLIAILFASRNNLRREFFI